MKNILSRKTLLGVALLGTLTLAPLVTPATQAAPRRDRDNRDDRGAADLTGTVTNVRTGSSFDLRANGRTYNVYTAQSLPRGLSRGDQVRVSGRLYGENDIRRSSVSILSNNRNDPRRDDGDTNGRYDPNNKRGDRDNGYRGGYQSYSGVVTELRSDREFNARVDGTTYNIYANSGTRGLRVGDGVRIYGQRYGVNDIRNASVNINSNGGGVYGPYQTYTGSVTEVRSDRQFDVRIGGTTYNVYAATGTRGLNKGDSVRVYGQRFGDNDIRNSRVEILRNGGSNQYGPYRSYKGEVRNLRNNREFDLRIGGETYNVYASSGTRDLNNGDEVRVYGRSYGVNDIRNASVVITRNR